MTSTREVDWRTCPICKKEFPWRKDTDKVFKTCGFCRATEYAKSAVALATAGHGTEFGKQGGKR